MYHILMTLFGIQYDIALHLQYIFDGFIGGVLYILVCKYGWECNKSEILRRLSMGLIAGHLVYAAGWPNSITAMSLGYFGIDAIESLLNKFNKQTSYHSKKKKKLLLLF